jgi:zona occludens toxin
MDAATKPITLITATPGGGKTALAVQIMMEAIKQDRPIFATGIADFKLPHMPIPPIAEWTEMRPDPELGGIMMPYFTFPPNSLIFIDEAQRIFRRRTSTQKVPDHVAAFETVRHTGVTFLIITQSPRFLDSHILELIGKHVHLRDVGLLGRWYYEWPEVEDNPRERYTNAPIKTKWKLPKETFGMYKSSSLHIKRKYTMPPSMMIIIVCALILAYGVWYLYGSIGKKVAPAASPASTSSGTQNKPVNANQPGLITSNQGKPGQIYAVDAASYMTAFVPVVPGQPETAPAYDALRIVKTMPRVIGGYCTPKECRCYNQQGLDAGLDQMQCRQWIKNPPFDPYREARQLDANESARQPVGQRFNVTSNDKQNLSVPASQ